MTTPYPPRFWFGAIFVSSLFIFVWDLMVPNGLTDWVWYFLPVYLSVYVAGRLFSYLLAGLISLLMVIAFYLAPAGIDPQLAFLGRLIGIAAIWMMAVIISHFKYTEKKRRQLDRALRTISDCNQVLIRMDNEPELLNQICRLIVERGGFRMCWVGFAENDEQKSVRIAARAGHDEGYLAQAKISWSETSERGRGPTGIAIRSREMVVCNDMQADPALAPWWRDARKHGYAASVVLPLISSGQAFGVLTLYASTKNAFTNPEEIALLRELSDDLAFGLHTLRARAAHQQAQEALAASQKQLQFLMTNTPAILYAIQATGDFATTFISPNVKEILGYPPKTFLDDASFWLAHVHPDDAEANKAAFQQLFLTGEFLREYRFLHANGSYRWMQDEMRLIRDAQGQPQEIVGYWLDITARKEATQLLKRSEQNYQEIFNATNEGIFVHEADTGRILDVNETAVRMYGFGSKAEFITAAESLMSLDEPAYSLAEAQRRIRLAVEQGPQVFEWLACRHNGERFWVEVSLRSTQLSGQTRVLAVVHDISERKAAAAALHESEARLRAIADNLPQSYVFQFAVLTDGSCKSLYSSRGVEQVNGVTAEAMLNDPELIFKQLAPEFRVPYKAAIEQSRQTLSDLDFDLKYQDPKGNWRWKKVTGRPRRCADGTTLWDGVATDITAAKEAENAASRMAALVESSNDAIISKDLDGVILTWNHGAEIMFGYAASEMVGTTVAKLIPPERAGEDSEIQEKVLRGALVKDIETVRRTKDGRLINASVSISPIKGRTGKIIGFSKVARDITARVQAETDLRAKNARIEHLNLSLRAILEVNDLLARPADNAKELLAAVCKSLIKTRGYKMVWAGELDPAKGKINITAHAGIGLDMLQQIDMTLGDGRFSQGPVAKAARERRAVVINDVNLDADFGPWRENVAARGIASIASAPLVHADKLYGVLTIDADRPHAFDAEEVALLSGLAGDVARTLHNLEERAARRLAEENLKRLATAVEQSAETIVITDTDGKILYANPAFEKTSGYTRAEALGQNPRLLKSGKQDSLFYRQMWDKLAQGEIWNGHFVNKRKDGKLYEEDATISPIRDEHGRVVNYVAVKRDVTHELQLEAQFRQTQKMEAMGTLAGGIAHDFNNILTVIFGYGYMLQMATAQNPQVHEKATEILKAAERAKDLVQQILMFSRQHEQKREVIRLGSVIKEATKFLRASLPANIQFDISLAEDAPAVLADPTQIYQVVLNLATNALHAMENVQGRLTVKLESFTPDEKFLGANPKFRPMIYTCLTIADTGHGMDAKTLERIFEPFFTTKPIGKGTGLGLAVVHGVVQSHDGLITVESEVGQGTRFNIYFPGQSTDSGRMAVVADKLPMGHGQMILVVDDETIVTTMLQKLLRLLNYQVTVCNRPGEALALFRNDPDACDLVITDLTMPDLNGLDLARALSAINPELPIILTSGFTSTLTEENLRQAGICQLLPKPVAMLELAKALQQYLHPKANPH